MSAFDELQRQLVDSVSARPRFAGAGGFARWWRGRLRGGALVLAIAAGVPALTGAMVLAQQRFGPTPRHAPARPLLTASATGPACAPCHTFRGQLHAPLGEAVSTPAGHSVEVRARRGLPIVVWTPHD